MDQRKLSIILAIFTVPNVTKHKLRITTYYTCYCHAFSTRILHDTPPL